MRLEDRFWNKVLVLGPDECWEWQNSLSHDGYGWFRLGSNKDGKAIAVRAHRLAYELTQGPVPRGMYICHTCDNRRCCNPAHLFLGTHRENMQDMTRKHRAPHRKLTPDQILEIRNKYSLQQTTQRKLASEYGVDQKAICLIIGRKTYQEVE
jgi:hypothetical protein